MDWNNLLPAEISYWEDTVSNKNGRFHTISEWLKFDTELQSEFLPYVNKDSKIIDVGAAICTKLGKNIDGNILNIIAIDILADEYNRILNRSNIISPIKTQQGSFETIVDTFGKDSFDFVYSSNAVDHCKDPMQAINNLYEIIKPGGYMYISFIENEALRSNWEGLHQWNFYLENENIFISDKLNNKTKISYPILFSEKIEGSFNIVNFVIRKKVIFESDVIEPYLESTPWSGHREYAYNLIKEVKPNLIVELGTHFGCSFMAFCQAVKDSNLNTKLIAVDTWKGDVQAGFYDENIYLNLSNSINKLYSNQNIELKRMLFSEALPFFDDKSIDILHIDGCHYYKNIKEDFNSYLPKMKDNGIMLFHDIAISTGYGTALFWNELKLRYKNYVEFEHSWGLGVLFLGDKIA